MSWLWAEWLLMASFPRKASQLTVTPPPTPCLTRSHGYGVWLRRGCPSDKKTLPSKGADWLDLRWKRVHFSWEPETPASCVSADLWS